MKRKVLIIVFVLLGVALAVIGANYAIYVMRVQGAQQKLKNDFALLDKIEEIKDPLERQQEVARNFLLRCPEIMGTGVKDGREKDLCKRAGEVYRQAKEDSRADLK